MTEVFDDTQCTLGEGPLWHPERRQLFWFDILRNLLLTREEGRLRHWSFRGHVSAAGWVDRDRLVVASETGLDLLDLSTGDSERLAEIEASQPKTRSNDGRADPQGGFWIGTMCKDATAGAGAIYRYYRGEVRRLYAPLTIPNAICFAPDGETAYFADTTTRRVHRKRLDNHGWPAGESEVFLDLAGAGLNPDGAVVTADGNFWNAQWGAARVAVYDPEGREIDAHPFPAAHTSCPAFGGDEFATLFCTSARQGLTREALDNEPRNGMTFSAALDVRGQPEYRVVP